jgi:hypothetical protein
MGQQTKWPRINADVHRFVTKTLSAFIRVHLWLALLVAPLIAQNAELSGLITDPSGLVVPGAKVVVQSADTRGTRTASSNGQGEYSVPALLPGPYNITIEANGFKTVHQNGVVVEVGQRARLDFALTVGSNTETITVQGSAPLLNASDASVSTLIGNQFVENLPLNGRSFSSLIDLTPGVVLTPTNFYEEGQFSVNGQRPDANYFLVDGVAANVGTSATNLGQGGAGQLPATSAFGGTSNLVSLDALEEFRIQTSTFAPEYGRTPGAQISVVTKSGTNTFHGTAFEYFRNDELDANDWFANENGLARPELRQNDFGGVLGGPIKKDKLFFFGSYEGLLVRQPQVADTYVPSLASRENAPAAVQPLLNAFPLPNGPNLGNGTAAFSASYSNPSTLNSYGIRIDYLLSPKITVFGRYSDAPSSLDSRGGSSDYAYSNVQEVKYRTQSLTLGTTQGPTPRFTNEFRFNYSRSRANTFYTLDNFGGAVPPPESALFPQGAPPQNSSFVFFGDFNPYGLKFYSGDQGNNLQQQINVTDNASRIIGSHQMKFGLDYRRLSPENSISPYAAEYVFGSLSSVLANTVPEAYVVSRTPSTLIFSNWSLFAQDTWKATRSLTIAYGLRWEYNAAPSSPNGTLPFTVTQVNDFATMTLAPPGTPLWHPQFDDFAPRLGLAWQPLPNLVLRAGAGIFYDLGYSAVANGASAFPYLQTKLILNTSFPPGAAQAAPPPFTTSPPVSYLAVVDPNHVLPRTYEWNAAVERTFGKADVLTVTYLGSAGRKLMRQDIYEAPNPEFTGELDLMRNDADSSYNAFQVQYRHRLAHRLQTLLSYTWAHSIDDASSDAYFVNLPASDAPLSQERGSSDYDIRHTFSGAVSYNIPAPGSGIWKSIFGNWGTDSIVYARSAPPVNVVTGLDPFNTEVLSGAYSATRPNLVPGVPLWISDPNVAGGRRINPAAFTIPTGAVQGDLGRNALRGFGATNVDLTLRRQFRLHERLTLQARADLFNIFNHPNFGPPTNYLSSPLFGQSTQMLGASLGSGGQNGGLNPLYQIGGPRSVQLALKLLF